MAAAILVSALVADMALAWVIMVAGSGIGVMEVMEVMEVMVLALLITRRITRILLLLPCPLRPRST